MVGFSLGKLAGLMIGTVEGSLVGLSLGITIVTPLEYPNPGDDLPVTLLGAPWVVICFWRGHLLVLLFSPRGLS